MNRSTKKIIEGVVLVLLAIALILSAANVSFFGKFFGGMSPFSFIAVIFLLYLAIKGAIEKNWFMVFIPVAVILTLVRGHFGIPNMSAGTIFFAAGLLWIGFEIIFPGRHFHVSRHKYVHGEDGEYVEDNDGKFVEVSNGMDVDVSFGSSCKYFETDDFTTSKLEANFGSIKAYYDKTKMRDVIAHIDAEANFGEIEIYVPREWETKIKVDKAFGGVDEKGSVVWDGVHIVYIDAEANFGSVIIHHM